MNANLIVIETSVVVFIVYTLLATWACSHYKRSIKKEHEEKLEAYSKSKLEQEEQIRELNESNEILRKKIKSAYEEIDGLHEQINYTGVFRNDKGSLQKINTHFRG